MKHMLLNGMMAAVVAVAAHAQEAAQETIELPVGGTHAVELPSNPTTGYMWQLSGALNSAKPGAVEVRIELKTPAAPKGDCPMMGAPQNTMVTFTGLRPGAEAITLVYRRPWEKNKPAAETRRFRVIVK